MVTYVIGADNINGQETSYINRMKAKFEEKGHTVESVGVGPNNVQRYGLSSNAEGKEAVYIVGGSDIGTYVDMLGSYYHYDYVWFAFASWTATTWITCEALAKTPLVRAHDDNFSSNSAIAPYIGKPAKTFFDDHKDQMYYACGDTPEELAEKIMNGASESTDNDNNSSSDLKASLQKLMSPWDGDVEFFIRGDVATVRKIGDGSGELFAQEGVNIVSENLTISDFNPDTINRLIVTWGDDGEIVLEDQYLIDRFGVKEYTVTAVEYVTTYETEESSDDDEDSTETTTSKKTVEEVPITDEEAAKEFAWNFWHKVKRADGHSVETKVIGSNSWQIGEWVNVYIPFRDEAVNMYVNSVSHSKAADDEWLTSIKLSDYAPSLKTEDEEVTTEDEDSEEDIEDEEDE